VVEARLRMRSHSEDSGGAGTLRARATQIARQLMPRSLRMAALHPGATLRWFGEALADRLTPARTCRVTDEWTVRCTPSSVAHFRLLSENATLAAELAGFRRIARPGMILFDVGAHFGVFTLAALHYGGTDARVVAVEPSRVAVRVLRANLALQDAAHRVTVVEAAVGATDGRLSMLATGAGGGHYLVASEQPRPDALELEQLTLPTLAERTGLTPTHVKVDVEGHEGAVLDGAADWLTRVRPVLLIELHNHELRTLGRTPEAVIERIGDLGYRLVDHTGNAWDVADGLRRKVARAIAMPLAAAST
jgi:FkbM family methyltransferase